MPLNVEKAREAIREKIAKPLKMELEEAAWLIKKVIDGLMAGEIFKETILKGHDPKEFVVFSFGGAGPTHCCGYTFEAGVPKIVTFPTSPVFCALGSAVMDVVQYYETTKYVLFKQPAGLGGAGTRESISPITNASTTSYVNCRSSPSGISRGRASRRSRPRFLWSLK